MTSIVYFNEGFQHEIVDNKYLMDIPTFLSLKREEKIDKLEPIRNNYVNSKSDENLLIKAFDSMQQLLIKKEPVVKIKHDDIDISATSNKYSARAIMLLLLDIF